MTFRFNLLLVVWIAALCAQNVPIPQGAAPAAAKGAPAVKADCVIAGQVLNAATGEPLRKAMINLYRQDQQYQPREQDVDAAGKFEFRGLEPGRYILSASRTGYANQSYGAKKSGNSQGSSITLSQAQEIKDIILKLAPHGVISGRVLDEDGDPKAHLQVSVTNYQWQGPKKIMATQGTAITNDLGEYRIFGLAPGSYYVQASRTRQYSQGAPEPVIGDKPEEDYVKTYYPGTADPGTAVRVQVKSGADLRGVDFQMTKSKVVRVSGTVLSGLTGRPVQSFLMMVPKDLGYAGFNEMRQAMAMPPTGRFEFKSVPAGNYTLSASAPGGDGQMSSMVSLNVLDRPIRDLVVTVKPGGSIAGTLKFDGGADLDFGAETARVSISPANPETGLGMGGSSAEVKEDGTFVLKGVQAGRYRVDVYGKDGGFLKSAKWGDQDVLEKPMEIPDGGGTGTLELVLNKNVAEVTGTMQDKDGKALTTGTVVLIPEEKYRDHWGRYATGTPDQYGAFRLKNVRPGKYKLLAFEEPEGTEWMDPEFTKPFEKDAIKLELEEGQNETRQVVALTAAALAKAREGQQ